jgi:ATP adenylyltransferase
MVMSMEQLWAPWRLAYVAKEPAPRKDDGCFICRGLSQTDDRANQIVLRGPHSIVLLNRFPYNNGHLLVAPNSHKARLDELTPEETLEVQSQLARMIGILERLIHPDGFNLGVNLGKSAGAGLPGHLHWHIVPRWDGDTNFMPILTDTRVIVQSLESLYDLLMKEMSS